MAGAAAQITICGELKASTIAALVEVAMQAGAALLVQPRASVPLAATPLLRGEVVDVDSPARKLRRQVVDAKPSRAPVVQRASRFRDSDAETARRVLRGGPLRVHRFIAESGISAYRAQKLVDAGTIVASGVTSERCYALPGRSAKEAP